MRRVIRRSRHSGHRTATFNVRTHGHQHATHIGVVNDGRAGFHAAVHGAALHAIARELHRFLVRTLGNRNALHTHRITRSVHHDEHVFKATVFFAHQVAHSTTMVAILQHRGGAGFDAHLVFNADAMHIVAVAQRTVFVHHELGHHKQADALHTFRCALHTRQHQVHDVLGHVVFTIGDENFGAKNFVSAIGQRLGTSAHRCQIRTRLWLGQIHGAGPLT